MNLNIFFWIDKYADKIFYAGKNVIKHIILKHIFISK